MQTIQHQSHSSWNCTYHIVIVPKYRKKVLYGEIRKRVGEILRELAKQKRDTEIIEGTACSNHIHLVMSIAPKYSVANVIGFLKGKSAVKLHSEFGKGKSMLSQKNFWSRGYFVSTVGINEEIIVKYVQEQWKHDQQEDGMNFDLFWS